MRGAVRFADAHRPSHATIVAYTALFVALGGASYAAVRSPSPGGVVNACYSARTGALRLVNPGARCRRGQQKVAWNVKGGSPGATGTAGPPGPPGPVGGQGPGGLPGRDFDAAASLQPGQTLTGVWAVGGGASGNAETAIGFAPQLPAALASTNVQRIAPGGSTTQCPGPGQAASGFFCLYERANTSMTFNVIFDPATASNGANRRGVVVAYISTASSAAVDGQWAVTP